MTDTAERWVVLCGGRREHRHRVNGDSDTLADALNLLFARAGRMNGRLSPTLSAARLRGRAGDAIDSQTFEEAFVAAATMDPSLLWEALALPDIDPATRRRLQELVRRALAELLKLIRPRYERARPVRTIKRRRTRRPRFHEIAWLRTIGANLAEYVPERRAIVPRRLLGETRRRPRAELDELIVCVDQSGSMTQAAIPALMCAALMGASPALRTRIVLFDTRIVDVSELLGERAQASDEALIEALLDALLGARKALGGGTDIAGAVRYCEGFVTNPEKAHLVLVTDLFDAYTPHQSFVQRCIALSRDGVNVNVIAPLEVDCQEDMAQMLRAGGVRVARPAQDALIETLASAVDRR